MNTRLRFLRLVAPWLALAVLLWPAVSHAQSAGPVRSSASGLCIDVPGATKTQGTPVDQWACVAGATNEQWQANFAGGYFSLKVSHSGQCLDVSHASTAPGAPLLQWGCNSAQNQQFTLRPQGNGFALVARHSGLCVGTSGATQGSPLTQQACNGSAAQTWNVPVTTAFQSVSSNMCMNVRGSSAALNAAVIQWPCSGAANEQWQAVQDGGWYMLRAANSGQCLDVPGAQQTPGSALDQWTCVPGAPNEQFQLRAQGDGVALVARHSGQCVEVPGESQSQGITLVQQTCNGSTAQTWRLVQTAGAARLGSWDPVKPLSIVPVAAANLPDGRVLLWSAEDRLSFNADNGTTYTSIFDPAAGNFSEVRVTNTGHDMFCPGIANLSDGRIHVTGGLSSYKTSIYNPATGTWSAAQAMNISRGYQGAVSLSTGDVFTIGGSWSGGLGNKDGEVWSATTGAWRRTFNLWDDYMLTSDAQGIYRADNHAWLFAASGGRVFHAGPSKRMNWFDTNGNGAVYYAGYRAADGDAMNGNAVMYDINKILTLGGAPNYVQNSATANAHIINISTATPTVKPVQSMAYARAFHNSVVLPDGKVLVVGGQTFPVPFSDDRAVLTPELFDPATETFKPMAPLAEARTYHSTALLLPDGRVLSGGGGLCGTCATNHPNVQIWSPPYLFNADGTAASRPVITSAPAAGTAGAKITVATDKPVTAFSMMRMSSVTHSVNNEQRRVPLSFTTSGTNQYALVLPADRGVLTPGYYMLFALNATGVPSKSRIIRIP